MTQTTQYDKGKINIQHQRQFQWVTKGQVHTRERNREVISCDLPWFTNSGVLLVLPEVPWESTRFEVLTDEMLFWDWTPLFSISIVLVLQKSSDMLFFLADRPWILSLFDGSSTAISSRGWVPVQHPRQPLLCYKLGLSNHKKWLVIVRHLSTWFPVLEPEFMKNCNKKKQIEN